MARKRTSCSIPVAASLLETIEKRAKDEGITVDIFINEAVNLRLERKRVVRLIETNPRARMPFGKFEGQPIQDLSTGYLTWARDNATHLGEDLRDEIRKELTAREESKHA